MQKRSKEKRWIFSLHSEIDISISSTELSSYTRGQISHLFPDRCEVEDTVFEELQTDALLKLNRCFSEIDNKYFRNGKKVFFNHLNGDQYSMFLYLMSFLANDVYKNRNLASKLYLLNKMLHGIDVFYEVTLPEIFLFVHPVGTVLGRAKYGEFFTVYQGCGVGSNNGVSPTIGSNVTLHPNSFVLGNSRIGNDCAIATGALVLDSCVDDSTTYIGRPGAHRIVERRHPSGFFFNHD